MPGYRIVVYLFLASCTFSVICNYVAGSNKSARPQQKRVARMDKIMNDILRHKRMEANERKSPAGTPQRPLPKLKIRKDVFAKDPSTSSS